MKTCTHCGIEKDNSCFCKNSQAKDGLGVWCKDCVNIHAKEKYKQDPSKAKAYRDANKDEAKAYSVIYRAENAEVLKAAKKEYSLKNKERRKAKRIADADKIRVWRKKYNEQHREENRLYRIATKDRAKETKRLWLLANPEARRIHKINHRARVDFSGGTLSRDLREKLFKLQKGVCPVCRKKLPHLIKDQHLDHIIPMARDGMNIDSNIQLLCQPCNNRKHAKDPIDFMQQMGYLI